MRRASAGTNDTGVHMIMLAVEERVTPSEDFVSLELSWERQIEKGIGLDLMMFRGQTFNPRLCRRIFNWFISQGFSVSIRTVCRHTVVLKKEVGDGKQYVVWLGYECLQDGRLGYFENGIIRGLRRDPDWTPVKRKYWYIGD